MLHHALSPHMIQPQALQYATEVADTGSLRMAAQKFNVAPSVISRQIAHLERDFGVEIFERTSRGMVPTPSGRIVLDFLAETAIRMEKMRSDVNDLTGLKRGVVRLAVVEALASDFLAQLLLDFGVSNPGIEFRVTVCGTHEIADQVVGEKADIGLAFNVLSRDDLILQGRLAQPLQLICNPKHRLAAQETVSLSVLDGVRAALPVRSFGIRYLIDQAALNANIALSIVYEADSLAMLKALVRRSDLISFMPPLTFAHEVETGVLRAIDLTDQASRQASIDLITARRHPLSSAARAFLAATLDRMRRYPA